jgi:predicted lipoprotein with Yx(FWY)xxD motif
MRAGGAGLLFATGAVHLDLYLTGYRTIPTIGWLFLLQVISAFGLALVVLITGWRIAATAGAGFCVSTLAGYLVSLRTPLFGFREVRTTAGIVAGIVEVVGVAALATIALRSAAPPSAAPSRPAPQVLSLRGMRVAAGVLVVLAAVALGVSLAATSRVAADPGAFGARLEASTIGGMSVLTDAQGFTLYWFSQDTPTRSACTGDCGAYWLAVTGSPTAGPGVLGTLGTIPREGGTRQATYDGHPLYTYVGDASPGENHGNDINLNGGTWHEVLASGGS